jgi:MFS family permease
MTIANRFIGPPLGGLLFAAAPFLPAAVDSASFLVAALVVMSITGRYRPSEDTTPRRRSLRSETAEGLGWLWHQSSIRAFALGAGALNVGVLAGESILVLFAAEQLHLSGVGFGGLFAAVAAGYVSGSALAPWLTARIDRRRLVLSSVMTIGLALVATGMAGHWSMAAAGLFAIGLAEGIWDVIAVGYRQAVVPDRLRGRIMSAYRVIAHGAVPLGALIGGLTTRVAGNRAPFIVGALIVLGYLPFLARGLRGVDLDPASAALAGPA